MAVTLAEAKNNTQTDYDPAVIDEFRKVSALLDGLVFDDAVNPAGGGATLTYGYRRLVDQANAAFRVLGTGEYTDQAVTTTQKTVNLAVLGGSFGIDRVLAKLGPQASGQIALHIQQIAKATKAKFQDTVINGDTASDANSFDGLSKALTGSATEVTSTANWSDLDTDASMPAKVLDVLDDFLGNLDGTPTFLVANKAALARIRAAARRSSMYVKDPVEGLVGSNGRPIERETYGGITLIDAGEKAGSSTPVIPVTTKKTDIYAIRVGLDGFHGVTTVGGQLVQTWLPDFSTAGAIKRGEVELGPVGVALKATKAAAVLRGVTIQA